MSKSSSSAVCKLGIMVFSVLLLSAHSLQAQVNQEWIARYNGPNNGYDYGTCIAVDPDGNVIAAGYVEVPGGLSDYAVVKYDAEGVVQWEATYNGWNSKNDYIYALAVDEDGYIYVTGFVDGGGTSRTNIATIMYSPEGESLWVRTYNGPGNSDDQGYAIAVDARKNVYVTGFSDGGASEWDYVTIKYDSLGVERWTVRYINTGPSYEVADAIAIDEYGNVYVTGYSGSSTSDYDYATVKYNSMGTEQWVARYNGPADRKDDANAIAVDGDGNVYVTGVSQPSSSDYGDYLTIKYSPDGDTLWTRRYNGSGGYNDEAVDLALDSEGNVYITGRCYGIDGPDFATVKYSGEGVERWVRTYDGPGNSQDQGRALALDRDGAVYVTGTSIGEETYMDYATIKYDPSGAEQWVIRYDSGEGSTDDVKDITVDDSGNVYITGGSYVSATGMDCTTIKYSQGLPPVSMSIIPDNPPVVVPRGGSFGYTGTVTNNTGEVQFVDIWTMAFVPGIGRYGPLKRFDHVRLNPHQSHSRHLSQNVPNYAPVGDGYSYCVYAGDCPSAVIDSSCFTFEVIAGAATEAGEAGWVLTGSFLEDDDRTDLPCDFALLANYPNPFNATTVISYQLPTADQVRLEVFDLLGQKIATLVDSRQEAGYKRVLWNASGYPSGVYFYKLAAGGFSGVNRMMLLK
jgi:uncharacterized delta-60 repeat protein